MILNDFFLKKEKEIFLCKETKPVISPSIELSVLSQHIFFYTIPLNAKAVGFVLFLHL